MYKHVQNEHGGDVTNVNFKFQVEKTFKKPLQRQLYEAKCIDKTPEIENLNSKDEFNGQSQKTLEICNKKRFNCKICGQKVESLILMEQHNEKFHRKYMCNLCDYESFGKKELLDHQQNRHT